MNPFLPGLFFLIFLSCTRGPERYQAHYFAMDTIIDIVLYVPDKSAGDAALEDLKKESGRIEQLFSAFMQGSEIQKINRRADRRMAVTVPEVAGLIREGINYGEETNGRFDLTIGPLKWLWGFGTDLTPHLPPADSIRSILAHVNFRNVSVRGDTVFFADTAVQIDMGGIAKGYALIQLEKIVRARGISSYMINAGGDIVVGEKKPGGKDWVIGIRPPRSEETAEQMPKISVSNTSIVSSGDYERFFIKDSVRYHHIFDPKTGYPARGIISATAIGHDPIRATIYSKILILRGTLDATAAMPGIDGYYIMDEKLNLASYPAGTGP